MVAIHHVIILVVRRALEPAKEVVEIVVKRVVTEDVLRHVL